MYSNKKLCYKYRGVQVGVSVGVWEGVLVGVAFGDGCKKDLLAVFFCFMFAAGKSPEIFFHNR